MNDCCKQAKLEGFNLAKEMAAKVSDKYHLQNYLGNDGIESPAQSIAYRIRALQMPEPK